VGGGGSEGVGRVALVMAGRGLWAGGGGMAGGGGGCEDVGRVALVVAGVRLQVGGGGRVGGVGRRAGGSGAGGGSEGRCLLLAGVSVGWAAVAGAGAGRPACTAL
jgi:hypothetical protein